MTQMRFAVRWHRGNNLRQPGWVVCDREKPITITWLQYSEALQHRDRIAELYARWGW